MHVLELIAGDGGPVVRRYGDKGLFFLLLLLLVDDGADAFVKTMGKGQRGETRGGEKGER